MSKEKLVSIIIPVYNVEQYIERCVESVLEQTYDNLDILLIDDGSRDGSGALCDALANNDERIRVFHKKNGGLSDARNMGLDKSKGEYVFFLDSDDYIHKNTIEILYNELFLSGADFVIAEKKDVYDLNRSYHTISKDYKKIEWGKLEFLKELYGNKGIQCTVAWGKLYKKELFKEIRYPVGLLSEDEATMYKLGLMSKKVSYLELPLYYYMQRGDSIMGNEKPDRCYDYITIINDRHKTYEKEAPELLNEDGEFCLYIFSIYYKRFIQLNKMKNEKIIKEIYTFYYKKYKNGCLKKHRLKDKVRIVAMNYCPRLYARF